MDLRIILFADVTILRLDGFVEIGIVGDFLRFADLRRKIIRRGEHRLAAQFADAGLMERFVGGGFFLGLALLDLGFDEFPSLINVRAIKIASGLHQPRVIGVGQGGEQRAVRRCLFDQGDGGMEFLRRRRMFFVGRHYGRAA